VNLLVVGSVALDDVEVPGDSVQGVLGGAACYFAVAARFFAPVRVVAVIGSDFPPEHLEFLRSRDIDTAGIYEAEGRTFRWGGRYHEAMNRRDTLFTELGVFEGFEPQLPESYRDSEFVFLANIHPSLQSQVLRQVRTPRFSAMDTMNLWIDTTREDLLATLSGVHGITVNDEEAVQLTGERNLVRAAEQIHQLGPETVIVKRGEHGALLFDRNGIFAAPAFPLRQVVDPTGAGDSFAGGFMGSLVQSGSIDETSLRRAVIYGSTMASFCVEDFSLDRFRTLEWDDIELRFEAFRSLTRF